jgi:hypothetical protein
VSLLVWNLTLDLSGLGDPASSYATVGIALEIIGVHKPHRHDKAETPPGGWYHIHSIENTLSRKMENFCLVTHDRPTRLNKNVMVVLIWMRI